MSIVDIYSRARITPNSPCRVYSVVPVPFFDNAKSNLGGLFGFSVYFEMGYLCEAFSCVKKYSKKDHPENIVDY